MGAIEVPEHNIPWFVSRRQKPRFATALVDAPNELVVTTAPVGRNLWLSGIVEGLQPIRANHYFWLVAMYGVAIPGNVRFEVLPREVPPYGPRGII